ncbi:MAG: hypothetical protein LUF29_03575 [Oscillospiraceae bacterium]|nr:hypothetical protein [Oscillospiraceae bacterium]
MGRRKLDPEVRLERVRQRRRANNKRYYGRTTNLYPGRAWTKEEEEMVLAHTIPDSELSAKIERSVKGIQEKRRRLKKEIAEAEAKEKSE